MDKDLDYLVKQKSDTIKAILALSEELFTLGITIGYKRKEEEIKKEEEKWKI